MCVRASAVRPRPPPPPPRVASLPPLAGSERGPVTAGAPGGGPASRHLSSAASLSQPLSSSGSRPAEDGGRAPRRPGAAAPGLWLGTPLPAAGRRAGAAAAARRPGGPVPGALRLPPSSAGLQSQEAARARLEGAVGPAAPRHLQSVSRGPEGRGRQRIRKGTALRGLGTFECQGSPGFVGRWA